MKAKGRRQRITCIVAAACACLGASAVLAEEAAVPQRDDVRLEAVVVKGQALRNAASTYSGTVFDTEQIRDRHVTQPQELFRWVPGMNVRNFGLGAVADSISLRGFSSGGHGGDIGMVIDGIPLNEAMSHADGYSDLNVVIPLEVSTLTVLRGPVSPLYGNFNRGGLIVIDTRKSGAYRQGDFSAGSNSTGDAQVAYGARLTPQQQLNLAAQLNTTAGFRPQSDATRSTLAGRWAIDVSPTVQAAVSGRLHRGEADSASYLTQAQFDADPYGKDPRVGNDGAEKNFGTLRADLNVLLGPAMKLLSFAYGTQQDFSRWFTRPVSANPAANWAQREETYDRRVFGAGVNLNGQSPLAGGMLNWVVGVETFRESTDYLFFDGLNQRVRVAPAIYDRTSSLDSVSAFAEVEAPLHRLFKPTLGLRYDSFSGKCTRNGPETGGDPCADLADLDHLSPKLGVRSDVTSTVQLRASWAEGFALPPNFIKYAPGAANLDPNVFRQTELGGLLRLADRLKADLAWYRIDSTQEVRTVAPGVYENFGATRRVGWEASVMWEPIDDLRATVVWAGADSEVTENGNPALLGKRVSGVPKRVATIGLEYLPAQGVGASMAWRNVGRYAVNPANTLFYDGFSTLDLGLNYAGRTGALRYRAYLRLDNLLDETYATSAFVIGGQTLYAPGAPRTMRIGVQLDF
jgi:outer membrane receptor protein involved in Fe transport